MNPPPPPPPHVKKKPTLVGLTRYSSNSTYFVRIFILSLKRTFLLSGSQLIRLYCMSGLSLKIKDSWQLCLMSSILNEPIFTTTQSLNLLAIFFIHSICKLYALQGRADGFYGKGPNLLAKRVRGPTKFASDFSPPKKSITKREMKMRSRIRRAVCPSRLAHWS